MTEIDALRKGFLDEGCLRSQRAIWLRQSKEVDDFVSRCRRIQARNLEQEGEYLKKAALSSNVCVLQTASSVLTDGIFALRATNVGQPSGLSDGLPACPFVSV